MNSVGAAVLAESRFRLLGKSSAICEVRERIRKLARSEAPVAIVGESGSGKELAARDLHAHSARASYPFVAVNCGAIPEALMESEFFGHRRGAFTGAHEDRGGFFQAAHRGTLFLDEIAELSLPMQVKLLRAIQEHRVRRLGAQSEDAVDVRVISATNQNLSAAVQSGQFRQDLYYRLQVIELRMPALRERREDIPLLCEAILARLFNGERRPELSQAALVRLCEHDFPGNVRELENILERAVALVSHSLIEEKDLYFELPGTQAQTVQAPPDPCGLGAATPTLLQAFSLPEHLANVERELVTRALKQGHFNRRRVAALLGISLRQLRYRMQRLAIHDLD